jgi:catechol 1,2-dioxygenase
VDREKKDMTGMTRRQAVQCGLFGAAGGSAVGASAAVLMLPEGISATAATPDVHGYESFLDRRGIPRIQPAGKFEPSFRDILGPFHVGGAPFRGKVTPPLEPGDLLVMRGRIWGFDTKRPVSGAVLDVWQADARGKYDMTDPKHPPKHTEFRNRIRLITDETGFYEYETIRPAAYRIGSGPLDFRPAHIHYMVQAQGYGKLITQMYFKGDQFNRTDRSASQSNLIIETQPVKTAHGTYDQGTFDLVLARG